MSPYLLLALAIAAALALFLFGMAVLMTRFYRKVEQGKALIVNTMKSEPDVVFTGKVVWPIIHKAEVMDISVKTIEIDRRGKEGLICKDNIRADIKVTFFVRVNKTKEDVLKVAQSIGCARASDQRTLEELFSAKFSEALKTVGKRMEFESLYEERDGFRDEIIGIIGRDLNGYVLEDAAIDYLEQTPLSNLDPSNILDAQGIRKITELTAIQHVRTNEYSNNERKLIKKQDVEAQEAILELERQQADAEAKQKREIHTVRAREEAEVLKVQSEEKLKSENARIRTAEEVAVAEENQARQVEIARKNKERVVAIETERVEKDRALEQIIRERETELARIAKEKELEKERKAIQEVIRERVAVEKTVAEEEERIQDIRVLADAKRKKDVIVMNAEAEAQEHLVKDIKAAEAGELASKFQAKQRLTLAEAELEAADKEAKAKMRLAEGVQAEAAAAGLAQVRVREADAVALEKEGLAQARVALEKAQAGARGEEAEGLARVKVKQADAEASERVGLVEATVLREKGTAEAAAIELKAGAMKAFDEATRTHEEFRLRVELERLLGLQSIEAQQAVAEAQARILSDALRTAKIDIVGGDAKFIDRLVGAISMGKAVDGFVDRSDSLRGVLGSVLEGRGGVLGELAAALAPGDEPGGNGRALTLSAIIGKLMGRGGAAEQAKLQRLIDEAREMGVDKIAVD